MLLIQATDSDGSQLAPPYADMNSMWSNIRDTNYPVAVLQSVCLSSLNLLSSLFTCYILVVQKMN
jgi:hypothetical protein